MIVLGLDTKRNSTFCLPNDVGNPEVPYNLDFNYFVSGQKFMGKKLKLAMLGRINFCERIFILTNL